MRIWTVEEGNLSAHTLRHTHTHTQLPFTLGARGCDRQSSQERICGGKLVETRLTGRQIGGVERSGLHGQYFNSKTHPVARTHTHIHTHTGLDSDGTARKRKRRRRKKKQRSGDGRLRDGGNKIRALPANREMHRVSYVTYVSISIYVPTRYKASRRR